MSAPDTPDKPPVEEGELHAFVDGQLPPHRLDAVLAWLADHPDDAVRASQWHAQRLMLRQLHRELDAGPVPPAMAQTVLLAAQPPGHARWGQALVAGLVLVVGLGVGAVAGRWSAAPGQPAGEAMAQAAPTFVRDAALAHAAFSPEIRHPVEVAAAEEAHLVQWLSRRLGQPLKAPQLQDRGFRLLGGRLLPGDPSPRAQFMYEDARGRRVTLYVTVFPADKLPPETAFRRTHEGSLESFYWVESRFGYALAADLPSADLMALARDVYAQLAR